MLCINREWKRGRIRQRERELSVYVIEHLYTLYYINTIWSNRYRNFLLGNGPIELFDSEFRQPLMHVSMVKLNSILTLSALHTTDNKMQIFRKEGRKKTKIKRYQAILFVIFSYSCFFQLLLLACLKTHAYTQASWLYCYRYFHRLHRRCCCCWLS